MEAKGGESFKKLTVTSNRELTGVEGYRNDCLTGSLPCLLASSLPIISYYLSLLEGQRPGDRGGCRYIASFLETERGR